MASGRWMRRRTSDEEEAGVTTAAMEAEDADGVAALVALAPAQHPSRPKRERKLPPTRLTYPAHHTSASAAALTRDKRSVERYVERMLRKETEEALAASLGQKADNTAAAKATKRQSVAPTPEAKRARSSAGAARPTTTATSASAATTVVEAHVEEEAAVEVTAEVVGELVMETMAQKVQASSCLA